MPSGSCARLADLPEGPADILRGARRAVLATIGDDARPHAVPVCFSVRGDEVVTAVDDKPKRVRSLKRIRNVTTNPRATLMVDRWDEDWTKIGWVMVQARARVDAPGTADDDLAARYEQYRGHPPPGPVIALVPERVLWWTAS